MYFDGLLVLSVPPQTGGHCGGRASGFGLGTPQDRACGGLDGEDATEEAVRGGGHGSEMFGRWSGCLWSECWSLSLYKGGRCYALQNGVHFVWACCSARSRYNADMQPHAGSEEGPDGRFEPMHWSVVLAVGREADAANSTQVALAQLCRTYWSPLYGFIRGRGYSVHDAQDLTQGFFCHPTEHHLYAHADRTTDGFCSFLLGSLQHFLADAYDRARVLVRAELRRAVSSEEAVDQELHELLRVLTAG